MFAVIVHDDLLVRLVETVCVPEDDSLSLGVAGCLGHDTDGLIRLGPIDLIHRLNIWRWQFHIRMVQQKLAAADSERLEAELGAASVRAGLDLSFFEGFKGAVLADIFFDLV